MFFAANLVLAIVWMLLGGSFGLGQLLVGFALGFVALRAMEPIVASRRYTRAVAGIGRLLAVYAYRLLVANLQLARDVLRPTPPFAPAILRVGVADLTRTEVVLLANLLSLTPGTITVDATETGEALFIHALYARDAEATRRQCRSYADLIARATGERSAAGRQP